MSKSFCLSILAALLVSACGSDTASYMVDGKSDTAFTMFRSKAYPGANWEVAVALTQWPECQRRHPLKSVESGKPYDASLYLSADGDYLLHVGDDWYQARLTSCVLQQISSVPATPGELVGTWQDDDQGFHFSLARKS